MTLRATPTYKKAMVAKNMHSWVASCIAKRVLCPQDGFKRPTFTKPMQRSF